MTGARGLARRAGGRVARRARAALADRRRAPTAVFARVLDGDHLWLAVGGVPSGTTFALGVPGGADVPLDPELVEDVDEGGGGVAVRAPLLDLPLPALAPGQQQSSYVVAVAPGGRRVHVLTPPLPDTTPMRTPASSRGWWQHGLERADDGRLVLTRAALEPWAELREVDATDTGLRVVVALPPHTGAVTGARLVAESGAPLDHLPEDDPVVESAGGEQGQTAVRVPAATALAHGQSARLTLGVGADAPLVVRRARNALTAPDFSVVLPEVHDATTTGTVLRWRFLPDGTLGVHRPEREAG